VPAIARLDIETAARAARPGDGGAEVALTEAPVAACHIEVARRRHLPLAKVAAGTVVLRFTIEADGRVRDAEALAADRTDLEVAACAKRVLSEWVFAKRAQGNVVVERMYRFDVGR
jgi:outer membrane biosynthesis protein TonB